ncbi:MAG TPA: hypothetical protein VF070_46200 [Streptosporangiaceae bacterium]
MTDRRWLVETLRHLGYTREAEAALQELPDEISMDQVQAFGDRYGISRDELMNRMGGSP